MLEAHSQPYVETDAENARFSSKIYAPEENSLDPPWRNTPTSPEIALVRKQLQVDGVSHHPVTFISRMQMVSAVGRLDEM